MKRIKDLTPDDFEGVGIVVEPFPFELWKEARLFAGKITLLGFLICWLPGDFVWGAISPELPKIMFILFFIVSFFVWLKPNRLARELGITGKILEEVQDNIRLKDFPNVDRTQFKRWRKSVIVRRTWTWIVPLISFLLFSIMYNFRNYRIIAAIGFAISLLLIVWLLIRPILLRKKIQLPRNPTR